MPNFMEIRPVIAELFHADGETDGRTDSPNEANSRFPQFCERAKKLCNLSQRVPHRERSLLIMNFSHGEK